MKTLVSFYSRTGNTRKVGEKIAKHLNADIDDILDKKDRSGIKGWLGAGKDTLFKKPTTIENRKDPSKYDLVIIGTPVWAFTITPAIKEYLSKYNFNKVAFFYTHGGIPDKTFNKMEKFSKKPLAVLSLLDKKINESEKDIKEFCNKLKPADE